MRLEKGILINIENNMGNEMKKKKGISGGWVGVFVAPIVLGIIVNSLI